MIECYNPNLENIEQQPVMVGVPIPAEIVSWYYCKRRCIRVFLCAEVPKIKTIHKLYGLGEFVELKQTNAVSKVAAI